MQGSRYDQQIAIFGRSLQHKLEALKVFLVGAGALGCEFLKNFAMMGLSIGSDGQLTVTDDDVIEKSNLSRQFLFRDWDIGRLASTLCSKGLRSYSVCLLTFMFCAGQNPQLPVKQQQLSMQHSGPLPYKPGFHPSQRAPSTTISGKGWT